MMADEAVNDCSICASQMLQHSLSSTQTHSVSSNPATVWQTSPCPLTTTGLSHSSPPQNSPASPSKCVDFTHFVWEGGKESSGPGGLQRGRVATQPKASVRQPEGRPLFPEPSPSWRGTEGQWTKDTRWNLMEKCSFSFPVTGTSTVTVTGWLFHSFECLLTSVNQNS